MERHELDLADGGRAVMARYVAVPAHRDVAAPFVQRFGFDFGPLDVAIAVVDEEAEEPRAMFVFNDYDRSSANIEMSVYTNGPFPVTRGVLRAIFWYPFNQLARNRVTVRTRAGNRNVRRMIRRLGFSPEGKLQGFYGEESAMIYGMLRESCPWL